jgi:hypothetical protein
MQKTKFSIMRTLPLRDARQRVPSDGWLEVRWFLICGISTVKVFFEEKVLAIAV